jgi:hypothetical protein
VVGPPIDARIEKANEVARVLGDRAEISALPSIAKDAGIGEVVRSGSAAVFFTDYMVDLAAKPGIHFLDQAVFAKPISPSDDEAS